MQKKKSMYIINVKRDFSEASEDELETLKHRILLSELCGKPVGGDNVSFSYSSSHQLELLFLLSCF